MVAIGVRYNMTCCADKENGIGIYVCSASPTLGFGKDLPTLNTVKIWW